MSDWRHGARRWNCEVVIVSLGALAMSCATATPVDIQQLLRRASDNEIALAKRYEGERLAVTGRVVDVGYFQEREVTGEVTPIGTVNAREHATPRAYVTLAPPGGEPGTLVCWVRDDDDLVSVERGARLAVEGYFHAYHRADGGSVYLRACEVARSSAQGATTSGDVREGN